MKTSKKIIIGGLGALTPIIMNLLIIDMEAVLQKPELFTVVGYLIRILTLFYLGGIVAWLHSDEESPVKLFELGIFAPALILSFINAGNVNLPKPEHNKKTIISSNYLSILSPAYAETTLENKNRLIYSFSNVADLKESKSDQFFRGLFGTPKKVIRYWVIVGLFKDEKKAENYVLQINKEDGSLGAYVGVYSPHDKIYPAIVGGLWPLDKAKKIKEKALKLSIINGRPENEVYLNRE